MPHADQIARSLRATVGFGREVPAKQAAYQLGLSLETVYALRRGDMDGTPHLPALLAIPQFAESYLAESFGYAIHHGDEEVTLEEAFCHVHIASGEAGQIMLDQKITCTERRRFRDVALVMVRKVVSAIRRKRARA